MKQQLLLLVDWAKSLPQFTQLPLEDQVALLRAYGAEHLLWGLAKRSIRHNDDVLVLGINESYVLRRHGNEIAEIDHVVGRILDEILTPMRDLEIDDTEYMCLKAIMFFNPYAHGISSRSIVNAVRQNILTTLDHYVQQKPNSSRNRFGGLLLALSPLQTISKQMVESLHMVSLFGLARLDSLLQEMLLSDPDVSVNLESPLLVKSPVHFPTPQQVLPTVCGDVPMGMDTGDQGDASPVVSFMRNVMRSPPSSALSTPKLQNNNNNFR